jgi:chromosomal replication initiator protein
MTLENIWQSTLEEIKTKISKANFTTWLKNSKLVDLKDGSATIALPNNFAKEWVESKYGKTILGIIKNLDSSVKKIDFIVSSNFFQENNKAKIPLINNKAQIEIELSKVDPETNLNPKYTFSSFVVGSSNELAFAAATAITKNIGTKYNPFFVYGGVGLGKTHLIQAIGNEIKNNFSNKVKSKYVTSEKFTNDVVWAMRNKRMDDIKKKYRDVDVLIIDDIQFIGGKEKTEEEFFHTFNALYELNKQIIISSDRPPRLLPTLEERLRSRFEGGLVAEITFPEYEMRLAIIKNKLIELNQSISPEIADLIAQKVRRNIRELEGILKQVILYRESKKIELDKKLVEEFIDRLIKTESINTTPSKIIKNVAEFYSISPESLISQSRKKEYVEPRQVAMYFMKEILGMSYPSIGEKLGNRDHTTIIHGYYKINQEINKNASFNQKIMTIKDLVSKG